MVLAALCPLGLSAQGIADVVAALEKTGCFEADATFNVSLPQSENDVVYNAVSYTHLTLPTIRLV